MESLFGFMNFLSVMGKDSFSEINKDIAVSYSKVAKGYILVLMTICCVISQKQKRGFSSLLGAVTVISVDNGKCMDYKVMSKKCSLCTFTTLPQSAEAYEKFINVIRDSHECSIS